MTGQPLEPQTDHLPTIPDSLNSVQARVRDIVSGAMCRLSPAYRRCGGCVELSANDGVAPTERVASAGGRAR